MENENKKLPQGNHQHKNGFHKKKPHKTKAYYMTPNEAEPAAEQKEQKKKENAPNMQKQKANQPQKQNEQRSQSQGEGGNSSKTSRNRRRRANKKQQQQSTVQENPRMQKEAPEADSIDLSSADSFFTPSKFDRLEIPTQKMSKFSSSPEYAKYSDYEEFTYDELYGKQTEAVPQESGESAPSEPKPAQAEADGADDSVVEVVGIKFKASGKTYFFEPCGTNLKVGSFAIVKTARGPEFGEVAMSNTFVKESETVPPLRPVMREATSEDIEHHSENKRKEDEAFKVCNEKIISHKLDMKLIEAQYTFDNSKLLFYFTSSGRVDFRELVKDLAAVFRTRIELRQIGIRDEAKMIGGLGPCGRPLCCSIFLSDFGQVSIKMAKDQNLSLNSSKISGICGRLMCCLRYEYEAYEYEIKHTPPVDTLVRTVDGVGTVVEATPITGTIKVKLSEHADAPPKTYRREEVNILKKKK